MSNHFNFGGDYFVSALGGNDSNAGSADAPFKTIGAAVTAAQAAGDYKTIVIGTGVYNETIAFGSNYGYHTFQGDGEVYLEGSGLTNAMSGYQAQTKYRNINFVNWSAIMLSNEQQEPQYFQCNFKNIATFNNYRQRYPQPYSNKMDQCTLEDCGNWTSELETGIYNNCIIKNSNTAGNKNGAITDINANAYSQKFDGCILDNPGYLVWSGNLLQGTSFTNCIFTAATRVAFYTAELSNYTHNGQDYMGNGSIYGTLSYGPSEFDPIGIIDNATGTFNRNHPSHSAAYKSGFASMYRNCFVVNEYSTFWIRSV